MFESYLKPPISFPTLTGSIVTFNSQYAGLPLKSHKVNIDSVSGVSAFSVSATGKNLYCKTATNTANGFVDNSMLDTDGAVTSNTSYCISEYIPVRGGEDITIQGLIGDRVYVCYYNANKEYIGQGRYSRYTERTYSLPSATTYIRASVPKENIDVFQIEYGDTATSYEAFNAHYLIQIGSTVNEGEYDARTGILDVTLPSVQTIQLPPCPIDTLLGVNNIWADTGDTTLQYPKFG